MEGRLPEYEPLLLPSSFDANKRQKLDLVAAGVVELRLREGQANDIILALRQAIRRHGLLVFAKKSKKGGITGSHMVTRVKSKINRASALTKRHAARYEHVRAAMVSLGMDDLDGKYRPIHKDDLKIHNPLNHLRLGKGKERIGWLWKFSAGDGQQEGEWEEEGK
jgi:hypothetical protein